MPAASGSIPMTAIVFKSVIANRLSLLLLTVSQDDVFENTDYKGINL